jgi:nucleoid DNA-binding protein
MLTQKEQDETVVLMKQYHNKMNLIHRLEAKGNLSKDNATKARAEFMDKVKDFLKELG